MFYEVAANTELVNNQSIIAPRENKGLDFHEPLVRFFLIDQYITILCMFLLKDTLFNIYYWFMNTELTSNSTVTYAWMRFI